MRPIPSDPMDIGDMSPLKSIGDLMIRGDGSGLICLPCHPTVEGA